jgi:L-amino acid N-acyltransferase YncA
VPAKIILPAAPAVVTMTESHWAQVRTIYQAGIDTGHATFAPAPQANWADWQRDHLNELSIVAENKASLALHRNAGFEPVGLRHRIGKMTCGPFSGHWRDVLLLERRSSLVGTE